MKITISLLSAAVAVTAAQPHRHGHNHAHDKREPNPVADVVVVPGPTEIAYVLNGEAISEADVQEGIRNGTLIWAQGGGVSEVSSEAPSTSAAYVPSSTSSSEYVAPTTSSTEYSSAPAYTPESSSSSAWAAPWSAWSPPSSSTSEAASSTSSAPSYTSASSSNSGSSSSGFSASNSGVNTPFPDGEVDCSTFPSEYGAVSVDWLGLGGWTGVQAPGDSSGGFSDIKTVTSGGGCTEGAYCSYACPAGYLKSQWPTTQGATGQSVGGVLCQNGKLHLTNSAMSSNLCMYGSSEVTILVNNTLSGSNDNVAVCRTDYPGTEGETVPLNVNPGDSDELACPDANNYYNWEGGHTSAQYYVNPSGVSVDTACQWGSSDNDWGNWAPLNLGVGYSSGAAWLAIFQNAPTTYKSLDFAVEVIGDDIGPGKDQTCRYSNGQYCGGKDYSSCSASTGCTVSISSGTATFVFSNGS